MAVKLSQRGVAQTQTQIADRIVADAAADWDAHEGALLRQHPRHREGHDRMNPYRDFVKPWAARRSRGEMVNTGRSLWRRDRPPDTVNPRAKGRRKGKVTADRWNQ